MRIFASEPSVMPGAIGAVVNWPFRTSGRPSTSSKMPWYEPWNTAILSRRLTVRAMRIAAVTASEPVSQNVARSLPDTSHSSAATSPASGDDGPISKPVLSCSATAVTTKSGRCPNRPSPNPSVTSIHSLPSRSHSDAPCERIETTGYTISFHSRLKPAPARGSASDFRLAATLAFDSDVRAV